jgi:peptide subunit release factor 1 (eRF1)
LTLLDDDAIRALAGFRDEGAPVTSCYLDVDGRRFPAHGDVEKAFATLVRQAGLSNNGHGHSAHPPSVMQDVERMAHHVRGLRRGTVRGLAMFSCSARAFWKVFELPVRVTSQLVVEPMPSVRQLEALLEEHERMGVLLVDRKHTRMYVFQLGELVDHSERYDEKERHGEDDRGELVKTRVGSQLSEQALQHVRRSAELAFEVFQRGAFDWLVVGAPPEVRSDLEHALHPYLRERIAGHVSLKVTASPDQIRSAAIELEYGIQRRNEAALVERLRSAVASGGRAVAGLASTLAALCAGRVDRLFVSEGYAAEGWRCPACGCLATLGRGCPGCHSEMQQVPDVVEVAVAHALAGHARVEVCLGNADLDVLGRIGALLRY